MKKLFFALLITSILDTQHFISATKIGDRNVSKVRANSPGHLLE